MQRRLRVMSSPPGVLRQKSRLSAWAQFGIRIALLLGLLAFVVAVHWIERDAFRDNLDGQMSFSDVIYFTMISATTLCPVLPATASVASKIARACIS